MLKFKAETSGGELYGFGLVPENIGKLLAGMPINVDLADMGGPPLKLFIMFGETEEAIVDTMRRVGMINPATTVSACPCPACVARAASASASDPKTFASASDPKTFAESILGADFGEAQAEAEAEATKEFAGEIRVNAKTGIESSLGFHELDPELVPALAAGFVVGWLNMPANGERLEELLALRHPSLAAEQQIAVIKDYVLGHAAAIGGGQTLAGQGHSLADADWELVSEVLGDLAKRHAARKERL